MISKFTKSIKKTLNKIFVIFLVAVPLIVSVGFLNPAYVSAQSCGGLNGLVNWKNCLGNTVNTSQYNTSSSDFIFISSGYTDYYKQKRESYVAPNTGACFVTGTCPNVQTADEYALNATVEKVISDIFTMILFLMFAIFVFLLFKSIFMYVTAGDNDETIEKAKKTFSTAGKGLLIVAIGFIVVGLVGSLLGLGNFWDIKLFV